MFRIVVNGALIAAAASSTLRADAVAELDQTVLPMLEKYCMECHDTAVKKADIDFEAMQSPQAARLDVRFWGKVAEQVRIKTMPPAKKKDQPTDAERQAILAWVEKAEKAVREMPPSDPGYHKSAA